LYLAFLRVDLAFFAYDYLATLLTWCSVFSLFVPDARAVHQEKS